MEAERVRRHSLLSDAMTDDRFEHPRLLDAVSSRTGVVPSPSTLVTNGAPALVATPTSRVRPRAVQPKLEVGAVDDRYERDADAMADAVMSDLAPDARSFAPPSMGRVARRAEVGIDGGAVSDDLARSITASSGSSMPTGLRTRMESGFGADFSGVRVHTESEVAPRIQARAFTHGGDVHFAPGQFRPDTPGGQHLIAHELAHVVQQTGVARRTIRRMTVAGTNFNATQTITVFAGGSSGRVAQFSDGGPDTIVVKVGESFGNEMVVGAALHTAMSSKAGATKGFKGAGPSARLATPAEVLVITYLAGTHRLNTPPRNFITGLAAGGQVLISKGLGGVDVKDAMAATAAPANPGELDPNSLAVALLGSKGPLTVLGQHAVVDVVMGMNDRLVSLFNPENFKYDAASKTFNFVDNVKDSDVASLVRKQTPAGVQSGHGSFNNWATDPNFVNATINGTLGARVYARIVDPNMGIGYDLPPHSKGLFATAVGANAATLQGYVESGVKRGLSKMKSILKRPLAVVTGISDDQARFQAVQSLLARRYFLFDNAHPDVAWEKATTKARVLVPGVDG